MMRRRCRHISLFSEEPKDEAYPIDPTIFMFTIFFSTLLSSSTYNFLCTTVFPIGDALMEPFWPQGTGVNRGLHTAWDCLYSLQLIFSKEYASRSRDEALTAGFLSADFCYRQRSILLERNQVQLMFFICTTFFYNINLHRDDRFLEQLLVLQLLVGVLVVVLVRLISCTTRVSTSFITRVYHGVDAYEV